MSSSDKQDQSIQDMLGRVLASLLAAASVLGVVSLMMPPYVSRLRVVGGYLATTLIIWLLIALGLTLYRRLGGEEEGKRHTALIYLHVYAFAFLANIVVSLLAASHLLLKESVSGLGWSALLLAGACLLFLWRATTRLRVLTSHVGERHTRQEIVIPVASRGRLGGMVGFVGLLISMLVVGHYLRWPPSAWFGLHVLALCVAVPVLCLVLTRISRWPAPLLKGGGFGRQLVVLGLLALMTLSSVIGSIRCVFLGTYDLMMACTLAAGLSAIGMVFVVRTTFPGSRDRL